MQSPKVSVSLTTYNHAEYIAQAIDSVLMQETDFAYELIIGEDDSSDGTRDIVLSYQDKYPERITALLNEREKVIYIDGKPTGRWNLINNLKHCKGEYLALLEGDDYWNDSRKLQKQVDLLEKNLDYSMCFHKVRFDYEDKARDPIEYKPYQGKPSYSLHELIQKNFIATLSVLYRNYDFLSDLPQWYYAAPVGDYPLHLLIAEQGQIGYIDDQMGVRRVHERGYWSSMTIEKKFGTALKISEIVCDYFEDSEYARVAQSSLYFAKHRCDYAKGKIASSFVNFLKCLYLAPRHISVFDRGLAKSLIDIFIPVKTIAWGKNLIQKHNRNKRE